MKVTIVDPAAYTPPYDHALCSALAEREVDVELVTTDFVYGAPPEPAGYRVSKSFYSRATKIGGGRPSRLRTGMRLIEHPLNMRRFISDCNKGDSVLVHFQWLPLQPIDARLVKSLHRPKVLTAHDILPREPRSGQLRATRKLVTEFDAVVVHSEHGRKRLVEELGVDQARVEVIPHGVFDYLTEQASELELDGDLLGRLNGRKVLLHFGLMRPYKGIDTAIEALANLPDDVVLLVVGMPRMPIKPLRELSERLGVADRTVFVPRFITDPEIPAFFRRANLVLLPYREIDQSGVLYTALAFNKAIVASSVGGFTELAREYGCLELVPPDRPTELARSVGELLTNGERRSELECRAASAAEGPFSWQRVAGITENLYRRLL